MEENFIPDYSKYDIEFLIDVYTRIDRGNNPLKAQALDLELKKRFNIPTGTEIDPEIVKSFINAYKNKGAKNKSVMTKNEEMIKHGWIAGVVVGTISLLSWIIAMLRNDSTMQGIEYSAYSIIDILGIFGLSYGISQKSRICAIILTSYFVLIKLFQIISIQFPQNIFGLIGLLIFTPFFIRAVIGTYNYHKNNSENSLEAV